MRSGAIPQTCGGELSKEKHATDGERERGKSVGGKRGSTGQDDNDNSPRTAAAVEMASVAAGRPRHLGRLWCGSRGDINCPVYCRQLGAQFTGIFGTLVCTLKIHIFK